MKTFQDLIREHPMIVTQNTNQHEGTSDTLTRWYNMWWGSLTDTHMQLLDDGTYIVTGSRMSKNFMDLIMYNRILPTAPFTKLPTTFNELLQYNHLQANMIIYNGQPAMAVGWIPDKNDEKNIKVISIPPATSITNRYYNPYDTHPCCDASCVDYM